MSTIVTPVIFRSVETADGLADQLESEGYVIGRPVHVSEECIAIDRDIATEATCDDCGHVGLEFLPWRPRDWRKKDYRAMAWCCVCNIAFEL